MPSRRNHARPQQQRQQHQHKHQLSASFARAQAPASAAYYVELHGGQFGLHTYSSTAPAPAPAPYAAQAAQTAQAEQAAQMMAAAQMRAGAPMAGAPMATYQPYPYQDQMHATYQAADPRPSLSGIQGQAYACTQGQAYAVGLDGYNPSVHPPLPLLPPRTTPLCPRPARPALLYVPDAPDPPSTTPMG